METWPKFVHAELFGAGQEAVRLRRIETMIPELMSVVASLDREIEDSEKRAGISDRMHVAYPTYARAALLRRDKLLRTIDELTQRCHSSSVSAAPALLYESGVAGPIPIKYRPRRRFTAPVGVSRQKFSVQI